MKFENNNIKHPLHSPRPLRLCVSARTLLPVFFILLLIAAPVFAQSESETTSSRFDDKLYVTFSYGTTASWLTRIIYQTDRSNFVFRDFLPGLYFCTEMRNVPFIIPSARIAVYYPLTSTFNHVPQIPNTPLHIAADLFVSARVQIDLKYVRINAGPGLHLLFLNSDRWNYLNLGIGAVLGVELALSNRWSLLLDGFASWDNGNLGGNGHMEPFDVVWQYQIGLGVRYSKAKRNDPFLLFINRN
ncbi:MAG: hypothetical protein FWD26_07525 [Treponema sp.]|nr:hypothetical protein [Treponema sp.]